ncbi:MAG: carboxypeptidase-like regulatory domain-containing protein [Candidatus Poribacteria bacterium]|nr:carboxypeptidase-like regulatory domain-containing protein [Candidatus Poribacteria bacterium]
MSYQNFLHQIVIIFFVIGILALLGCGETEDTSSVLSSETVIGGDTTSFSGRVVDGDRNPVAGLALIIQPHTVDDNTGTRTYGPDLEAETDDAGYFSITDIPPGEFQFMLASEYWNGLPFMTEYQLLSVKIGAFTYHPSDEFLPAFDRDTLSITPGGQIENVEVTVQHRTRVRAKIVFADGTPLANKEVRMNIKARDLQGDGTGKIGATWQTDAQGYFIQYVDTNRTRSYVVSVEYKGLSATSEKFVLKVGERREDLILKLSGPPQ